MLQHSDTHQFLRPDRIHSRVLRKVLEELIGALSIIYQQSQLTQLPAGASVMPIHKKGWKENLGKCRTASLTLVQEKIMEQIILGQPHGTFRTTRESGPASTSP